MVIDSATALPGLRLAPDQVSATLQPVRNISSDEVPGPERASANRDAGPEHRALEIFRHELKRVLTARFRSTFVAAPPAYHSGGASAQDVAADTLGAAQRVANEDPVQASRAIVRFRQTVHEVATFVRQMVGPDTELADVDDAVNQVSRGLDDIDADVARNVESSASILSVHSKTRLKTVISIQTQEGDTVRLKLRRVDRLDASSAQVSTDGIEASATEIRLSSRSRMALRIEGDINDAEMAAIRSVFEQAEAMADEFFDGDIAAAFELAAALNYDTSQLSSVDLRFRSHQYREVNYAQIDTVRPEPVAIERPVQPAAKPVDITPATDEPAPMDERPPVVVEIPAQEPVQEPVVAPEPDVQEIIDSGFAQFFDLLASFMRSVSEGFESDNGSIGIKFHYSTTFKLELLKAVFDVVAPEESGQANEVAAATIDRIAEED